MSFNQSVFEFINGLTAKLAIFDLIGIFFAGYFPYLVILFFIGLLFVEKDWKKRFYIFSLASLSVILARGLFIETIRFIYYSPRPALVLSVEPLIATPTVSSFPSGHTATFFAIGMAVYYIHKRLGLWFLTGALVIGIARVFVGVHWPLDILAGALLGTLSAVLIKKLFDKTISIQ